MKAPHWQNRFRAAAFVLIIAALCACSTSPRGRQQLTTPAPVGKVYSSMDMHLNMAATPSSTCNAEECAQLHAFNEQVQALGGRLSQAAFTTFPELSERIDGFEFVVADKQKPGSMSNASGKIVIFRGTQTLNPDETALAFLIAREMGHVICRHHDENAAPGLILTAVTTLLFPAAHLLQGSTALANTTSIASSATAASAAVSTATSFIGTQLILAGIKPGQLSEADAIAMELLVKSGWDKQHIASALNSCVDNNTKGSWMNDLRASSQHAKLLAVETTTDITTDAALPDSADTIAVAQDKTDVAQVEKASPIATVPETPDPEPLLLAEQNAAETGAISAPNMETATGNMTQAELITASAPATAITTASRSASGTAQTAKQLSRKAVPTAKTVRLIKIRSAKTQTRTKFASKVKPIKTAGAAQAKRKIASQKPVKTAAKATPKAPAKLASNNAAPQGVKRIKTAGTRLWPNSVRRE